MAGRSTKWMEASGSAPDWTPKVLLLVTLLTSAGLLAGACSGENGAEEQPPRSSGGAGLPDGGSDEPCTDGEETECHITIGEHEGVLTCLDGVRTCEGGTWGPCQGEMTMRSSPFAGPQGGEENAYPQPFSLSDAGPCTGNPCDPTCQSFGEDPATDIAIPGVGPMYSWSVGDINSLPEPILAQGVRRPCMSAEDCQFDQYCSNPSRGACSHDVCAPGIALLPSCSPCATKICSSNPSCCTITTTSANCAHDVCTSGSATGMTSSCDPCVANICAARPGCCGPLCVPGDPVNGTARCQSLISPTSTCVSPGRCTATDFTQCIPAFASWHSASSTCQAFWGSVCTSQVPTLCGRSCGPAPQWNATCASLVSTTCGSTCNSDPPCAHDKCYTGDPLVASCDPCVTAVCAAIPSCCSSGWTQQCVDRMATTMACTGVSCPAQGVCTSYAPNQTNPACLTVDLTLGVSCGGTIPVCNRGNAVAPAGVRIFGYPAGSRQIPNSTPNRLPNSSSPTGGTLACTTAQPISPGECISVSGCTGLTDGMELYVNPPGPTRVSECQFANNGSIYQSTTCQSPGCTANASVSQVRQVTMFFAIDVSTSMRRSIGSPTDDQLTVRWTPAMNAIKAFFADPASAGLGVALRFWPDDSPAPCNDNPSCPPAGGGGCATPLIPRGVLTTDAAPTDVQENLLINAIDAKVANGDTPMYPALDGATSWAISRKMAFPDEEVAVVFVTDGSPTACNTDYNAIATLARNAYFNHGIRVHALGFGNANPTFMTQMADQGGGQAYFLTAGATLQDSLTTALAAIRGDSLPCDVRVPVAGIADPSLVSVVWVDNMGTSTTLARQTGSAACGTGWYFDPSNPANIKLCPQTCSTIRATTGGRVQAVVPCESTFSPLTTSWERYSASCPPGTKAQWGYLRYETTTPGDSNVQFFARSADTTAALGTATSHLVATAQATPTDTQVCNTSSTPVCSVDLFTGLGGLPDARRDYLEVRMTLNPTSAGDATPVVRNWEITYSCPDTE